MDAHSSQLQNFQSQVPNLLHRERAIDPALICRKGDDDSQSSIPLLLSSIAACLESHGKLAESIALNEAVERITTAKEFGGLGIKDTATTPAEVGAGTVVRVGLDWILSSELSWQGMSRVYEDELGSPGIWRNDRFWLAADHVVHPAAAKTPNMQDLIDRAEKAKLEFKMAEYQGLNYTIMHTEFVRERAEPGMLVIGADSHTCSGGAVGCLAIGLGGIDVLMGLMLGETWSKIPESILVEFQGRPAPGISGKDVILHILKELKRNTVATERIVEFGGEGAHFLSCDARFTICNMATEFGAISGIFIPDNVTRTFITKRRSRRYQRHSVYFRPDDGAPYAGKYIVDLSMVEPTIALYPSPDNVVVVSKKSGMLLDGVFIGACTTTEEELVLAALVLRVGLKRGLQLVPGKRHYVPGSLPIVAKLESMSLLEIYAKAGFTRGPPGCSYCLGLSVDRAGEGETWLSSQNRNFQNRMGKGSFGHLSSAVVCASSSFSMSVTDPRPFLQGLDHEIFELYRSRSSEKMVAEINYAEPSFTNSEPTEQSILVNVKDLPLQECDNPGLPVIKSQTVRLGDFVDTDALAPGPALTSCVTDEDFGRHALEYTHPEFRNKVRSGQRVVVAGHAFGCGSSREAAVSALKGVGVEAVIARSFAFIFNRNMRTLGLLGFTISDNAFYEAVSDGDEIQIDVESAIVIVKGGQFTFELSSIEKELIMRKGAVEGYKLLGGSLWEQLTKASTTPMEGPPIGILENEPTGESSLEW
ncbi:hypothetical protein BDV40DRAFT_291663 [Aspergillus tamarii]|uniref:Aconitase family protein n=1 Tax=Aspergillus tamarii TaxID=41984 RepID=A0A5N6UIU8_ASPTM|nr:hypothetical protein BDV40DRAFT_291663 [Aspergillus tamarii]